ncbi:hypothetical protein FOCC_FOCC015645, partial [Frankliniella occidentalis]
MISTGAREREGTQRRIGLKDLAQMSGVSYNTEDQNVHKVLKTAQQYRLLATEFRRKLSVAQRLNKELSRTLNDKTINILNELVISTVSRTILEGEMKNFKKKVESLKARDRQCVLLFDEVFLRGRLFYSIRQNLVNGFENLGQRGRTNYVADHALVFMVQGLHVKWTQPVAYYFVSKTCPSALLKLLIEDVVKALTEIGLTVKATVSDQGPTNRTAIAELRQKNGDGIMYSVGKQRLVHIWDMPHILKNIRNNLITSDLEFNNGKVAKWHQLIEFYVYDQSRIKLSSLTMRHVNPKGRDKMRVSYAAQVLSSSVSKFIKAIVSISEGKKFSHCLPFAELCDDIDTFFDLCNGPKTNEDSKENQKKFRVNVSANSPHIKEEMWKTMLSKLQTWTFIRKKDGVRHIPPCVRGWIENIKSFRVLWCSVKDNVKVLKMRNINQDALENFFCLIRQCGGSSSDLTLAQFTAAMKTCLISRFSRHVSADGKNCQDDESHMASDLSEYLLTNEESTAAPP